MSERIVDALELIEVETKHGARLAARDAMQRGLETLAKEHAIRQVGERIMQRHVGDLRLGAALAGDVGEGVHEAAAGHRLVRYRDRPSVGELLDQDDAATLRRKVEVI